MEKVIIGLMISSVLGFASGFLSAKSIEKLFYRIKEQQQTPFSGSGKPERVPWLYARRTGRAKFIGTFYSVFTCITRKWSVCGLTVTF